MSFVHIHNHTEYSLLDGANRIPDMVARTKELGMDALAISDHGVMFGVMEFYLECQKAGIKPLIGLEAYVAPNGFAKKSGREENETFHLLLLAKDLEGYRNLCKLHSIAALQGYYYKPRIDHELLKKYSKGLIGTSACLGSEVCQQLLKGTYDKAQYIAGMYSEIFGEGNFFIELQDHRLKEQAQIKEGLLQISRELKLPLVATNDAHYLCRTDSQPHDVLLCIQTGNLVADTKRMKFETEEFYLKSPGEMSELFADTPEAIENTVRIAEMCNVELGMQRANMPDPELPEGETPRSYLRKIATENLAKRIKNADENALQRLNYELEVIEATGFESYFLLVREFADFTRDQGIYFGVRGSAAGSLVSYCLGITDIDPLEYDLTFERFLNPERVSMPDIDMDFEDARRDEVIRYVTEKYGADHVAQIVTFGTLGAKAAIKDCGRVQGYSPQETDKICKTIPNMPGMNIQRAMKESAEFRQLYEHDQRVKDLVEVAKSVEGMARHAGVHAAGIVISKEPLMDHIPLYKGSDDQPITAFEMGILEKIGLLKMDFLGLSNLTVLAKAVENINRSTDFQSVGVPGLLAPVTDDQGLKAPETHGLKTRATSVPGFSTPVLNDDISKKHGAYLPHWTAEGAVYHVVFRLADSLSSEVAAEWKADRAAYEILKEKGALTPVEEAKHAVMFREKFETLLDAGKGSCVLAKPESAKIIADAFMHFAGERYQLHAWCVMPNHVHVVVEPIADHSLAETVKSWKGFTAREINKLEGTSGQLWQPEYFDHIIRDSGEYTSTVEYVHANPTKAGLKDWNWTSATYQGLRGSTDFQSVGAPGFLTPVSASHQGLKTPDTHGLKTRATFDIRSIPLDDARTYEILSRGDTVGVFQLESGGMTRYVAQLKPQSVRELAAMVALYRPGPMEHIPRFIDTKFGRQEAKYLDEKMRPVLEETYGVIVYQDQVLKLVQVLAGFSLGKADILRRAMGKKEKKAMDSMQVEFMAGCAENGVSEDAAKKVWDLLLPFAGYAFNKAHAVCYAMIAYQTAYLKANYPVEYMAALLAVYRSKEDRVTAFIEDCRKQKIRVLPPDVNRSFVDFSIETPTAGTVPGTGAGTARVSRASSNGAKSGHEAAIRFGLAAIKGVGEGCVESIIKERESGGPFIHLFEFMDRCKPCGVNRSALEALVKAGAFDSIDRNRKKLLDMVDAAVIFADSSNRSRLAGQVSLFGEGSEASMPSYPALPETDLFSRTETLALEKEVMGIYVSDHPLRGMEKLIQQSSSNPCSTVVELEEGTPVRLAGVIAGLRTIITKNTGQKMATIILEDFSGQASVIVFASTFAKLQDQLVKDTVVKVKGVVMHRERNGDKSIEVRLEEVEALQPSLDLHSNGAPTPGTVEIRIHKATEQQLKKLRGVLSKHPGAFDVKIQIMPSDSYLPIYAPVNVEPSPSLVEEIQGLLSQVDVEVSSTQEAVEAFIA